MGTEPPMEGRGLKETVHKCHSDPGGSQGPRRLRSGRKCVLTLDGYSYVIGECVINVLMSKEEDGEVSQP